MNSARTLSLILFCAGLTACGETVSNKPVDVAVPGVPSPELALQKSIDRVHNFLGDLNGRIDTPVKRSMPLATAPVSATPLPPTNILPSFPKSNEAQPLFGKNGYVWFVFAEGYPHIQCTIGTVCLIHLQANETLDQNNIVVPNQSHWLLNALKQRKKHLELVSIKAESGATKTVAQLITSARTYNLLLDPDGASMRNIKFAYSVNDPATQPAPEKEIPKQQEHKADYRFKVTGPTVAWSPIRVFQENNQTFIEFSKEGAAMAPQLTLVSPRPPSGQSYKMVGNAYVVDLSVNSAFLRLNPNDPTIIQITHE